MNHFPEVWGRPRDDVYGKFNADHLSTARPNQHANGPIVTGTSVVAVKYKDGVVIASDNLASYGSLARFEVKRLRKFNDKVVVGFGGDVGDMQHIDRILSGIDIRENYSSDQEPLHAKNLHKYLAKTMYRRRTEFKPLWNAILIAGVDGENKPTLAYVDHLGTTYTSHIISTSFGAHLATPIFRREAPDEEAAAKLTKEQAVDLVKKSMKALFYRDARSTDKYSIAVISKDAPVELKEDEKLEEQSWSFAEGIRGYGTQTN